nr:DUF1045 domain-containing protein [Desulfobulbus propionicus]
MRFAISFTFSPGTPLWHIGTQWLGRDALSGQNFAPPKVLGLDAETLRELTRIPARHGLQAPLVPLFRLKPPLTEADLKAALVDFSSRQSPFALPPLALCHVNRAFSLCPCRHFPALQALAARCTRAFDRLRAPLNPSELAKHKAQPLSGQEKRNLEMWGNPYVFEQYRFAFPLTGRMAEGRQKELVHSALQTFFGPALAQPVVLDSLYLFVEPEHGQPLSGVHRFPLTLPSSEPGDRISHDPQFLDQDLHSRYQSWSWSWSSGPRIVRSCSPGQSFPCPTRRSATCPATASPTGSAT